MYTMTILNDTDRSVRLNRRSWEWDWYILLARRRILQSLRIIITHVPCLHLPYVTYFWVVSAARFVRVRGRMLLNLRPTGSVVMRKGQSDKVMVGHMTGAVHLCMSVEVLEGTFQPAAFGLFDVICRTHMPGLY
jgi:hypothetical protein